MIGALINRNVQRLCDARDWTIYRLSKNSGVSLSALYNLEKKKQGPNAETLVKLADTLGVTVDEIVRGEDDQLHN